MSRSSTAPSSSTRAGLRRVEGAHQEQAGGTLLHVELMLGDRVAQSLEGHEEAVLCVGVETLLLLDPGALAQLHLARPL
jgi:hypothetical protein